MGILERLMIRLGMIENRVAVFDCRGCMGTNWHLKRIGTIDKFVNNLYIATDDYGRKFDGLASRLWKITPGHEQLSEHTELKAGMYVELI